MILLGFSECCLCGAWTKAEPPFCGYCWERSKKLYLKPSWRNLESLSVLSLMDWGTQNESFSRRTLYHLKESRDVRTFSVFISHLLRSIPLELLSHAVLAPIPSSTGRYHSLGMAHAMSKLSGRPIYEGLVLLQRNRQPGLSKTKREERSFRVRELDLLQNYRTVILLDDVVTSGATLRAANVACLEAHPALSAVVAVTVFNRSLSTGFA